MVFVHIHANTDALCWPLILASLQMLNTGVYINCYSPVSFEEMEAANEQFKRGRYTKLWKLLIDRDLKKEGLVCIGTYKAFLGHRNGQGRSYEYRYPRKDMYRPALPFGEHLDNHY